MAIATYTKAGVKATTPVKLDKTVFGIEVPNHELLKQAYVAYLANGRIGSANVKTRGLVRGGGRKPWRQKGTGRARFGSIRNPIWRGGGIVFGPTGEQNHTHRMNTTAKRQAIKQALTNAANEDKVSVIEAFDIKSGKTSDALKLLNKLNATRKVLVVVENKTDETVRATSNLQEVKVIQSRYINVYDAMNAYSIVITTGALKEISDWLGKDAKDAKVTKDVKSTKEVNASKEVKVAK
jgi:large subunit ribosomal protein L4